MLLKPDEPYRMVLGDSIAHMATLPARSVDFSVFSPPFPALYAYSSMEEDIGNSEDLDGETRIHLSFFYRQFARILKPGRAVVVHVMQIPRMKRTGGQGMFDFRGLNIRLGERAGLVFEYDWAIRKNPQMQAITTRSRELQFMGLESDRARSRGAMPDYLLKFVAPGENAVKIDSKGDVSRNDWIEWAECTWDAEKYPVNLAGYKSMTLNTEEAKRPDDTRHICPLQLSIIDRLVRLYTNPGEIVLSPFAGIGSEGFPTLRHHRRFYGIELNPLYHKAAIGNLDRALAMNKASERSLFDVLEMEDEPPTGGCAPAPDHGSNGDASEDRDEDDDADEDRVDYGGEFLHALSRENAKEDAILGITEDGDDDEPDGWDL